MSAFHLPTRPWMAPAARQEMGLDLWQALLMVRRRIGLVLAFAAVTTGLATLVILDLPERWTAEALLVLNDRASRLSELQSSTESLLSRTQADLSIIKTQAEILSSTALLPAVVRQLDLVDDPAFQGREQPPGRLASLLAPLVDGPARLRGPATAPLAPERAFDRAVERLSGAVSVVNDGGSYAIRIRAEALAPELAARIANALAAAYLDGQRAVQADAREAASAWLAGRLREQRLAVLRADEAVERYRAENQLGRTGEPSLLDTRIGQVSSALADAGTRLSRAQAGLAEVKGAIERGGDPASAGSVLASPTIQMLRGQEAEILVRHGALVREYGPRHPRVAEADAQLEAVRAKIKLEAERIVAGMRSDVSASKGEIDNLQGQLSELEARRSRQADVQVKLADREREAAASREIYVQFLRQFDATAAQEAGAQPDARLVAAARPPLEPSGPNRKLLIAAAAVGSTAIGIALALAAGFASGSFGGPVPLEKATGLPNLEVLPELGRRQIGGLFEPEGLPAAADPIRGLALTIGSRLARGEGRVVLVTSSVTGEGKSLLCVALARALAFSGWRTLLVDLDPWRPSLATLARRLGTEAGLGTEASLGTEAGLTATVDRSSGLVLLAPDGTPPDAQVPAYIRKITDRFDRLRDAYDVVLLDAPPVLAVPDVLAAAAKADATIFVVRFEGPGSTTVRTALQKLERAGASLAGTVLSRVNARHYRRYGYGPLTYSR